MAEKMQSINLLPKQGGGLVDQFLGWALTIGRLLIILTETLALSVFFYRFSLDMRISDLHDKIKNQSAIASSFKSTEDQVRSFQNRLALAQKIDASGSLAPNVFADIINIGKGKVTFKSIAVSTDGLKIDVQAPSSNSLNSFLAELKNYPGIKNVGVDNVENKTSTSTIKLTISGELKTGKKKLTISDELKPGKK